MNNLKIEWTDFALKDLDTIYIFISKDSPEKAESFIKELIQNIDEINQFPQKGRIIPQINKEYYREIFIGAYRIMYKLEEERIYIMGIIHMSLNFKS